MRTADEGWEEALMGTLLLAAVLAILEFLCFTGPGGFNGPRHRH
jgi:hypothetical protein